MEDKALSGTTWKCITCFLWLSYLLRKVGCLKWEKHIISAAELSEKGPKLRADSHCSKVWLLHLEFALVWVCWSLDFGSMKILIPWPCLPFKCCYVWPRTQWDPGRWRGVCTWLHLGWRRSRSSPTSVKSAPSLARVTAVSTWRRTSNLLPGPWGASFFSDELGTCGTTHRHNRHIADVCRCLLSHHPSRDES